MTKTQKGVRQYGVDVVAKGKDEDGIQKLFIVTVKRGDINRRNWDSGPQSVRQSLNDIKDVYLRNLPKRLANLPYKIIVATNGLMNQDVELNWNGYIDDNSIEDKIEFDFWDINYLGLQLEEHLLNEYLLKKDLKVLLQKTLSLIDLNDYDLSHYYQLIEDILFKQKIKNEQDIIKRLRLLNLCQGMIFKWGIDSDNLKNVYISSERLMIRVADFFRKNELFHKKKIHKELLSIVSTRLKIGAAYFDKIKTHCEVEEAFSIYAGGGEIEYPLITFEQMGIIAQIGLECFYITILFKPDTQAHKQYMQKSFECMEALWKLIENNPSACYVLYDDHHIDISLALLLFFEHQQYDAGFIYINKLIKRLAETFRFKKFFPLFVRNYDKLLDIQLGHKDVEINSSHLFTILTDWSLAFGSIGNYDFIREIKNQLFTKLNLQIWFPDKDTENSYFEKNAMHDSGMVLIDIELTDDYRTYLERVQIEYESFTVEKDFQIIKNLYFVPLLASRHYRNLIYPVYWRTHLVIPKASAPIK